MAGMFLHNSVIFSFNLEVIIGLSLLRQGRNMSSSSSSKRLSTSTHFADKKGIQLSPSIYLVPSSTSPFSYSTVLSLSLPIARSLVLPFLFVKFREGPCSLRSGDERDSWSSSAYQTITDQEGNWEYEPYFLCDQWCSIVLVLSMIHGHRMIHGHGEKLSISQACCLALL